MSSLKTSAGEGAQAQTAAPSTGKLYEHVGMWSTYGPAGGQVTVQMTIDGKIVRAEASGEIGQITLAMNAINQLVGWTPRIHLWHPFACSEQHTAMADTTFIIKDGQNRMGSGHATHCDSAWSSVLAYIAALNDYRAKHGPHQ